jgi:2-polyprenyl-6-hydroxyphenyl methylase/3-demethylubiquinone-9 3-methyltransferase
MTMTAQTPFSQASSARADEVSRFAAMAQDWWDPSGPVKPLHKLNPFRVAFLSSRLARHFGRDLENPSPFEGLRLLDLGCGGGLVTEPMARLGFAVTAIDASEDSIAVARAHAEEQGLTIDYRQALPEELTAEKEGFDVVLALEIVEHVSNINDFLGLAASLVRPGGALMGATVNRTTKSWLFGIVGAEFILRWLPAGTHDWNRFVKPSEFAAGLRRQGVEIKEFEGLAYNPLRDAWSPTRDLSVNYLLYAVKREKDA